MMQVAQRQHDSPSLPPQQVAALSQLQAWRSGLPPPFPNLNPGSRALTLAEGALLRAFPPAGLLRLSAVLLRPCREFPLR